MLCIGAGTLGPLRVNFYQPVTYSKHFLKDISRIITETTAIYTNTLDGDSVRPIDETAAFSIMNRQILP